MPTTDNIDYRLAFELAPIGLALSRNRSIVDCNTRQCEMFALSRELLIGQTFRVLDISHRTVETYRARLTGKYKAATSAEPVHELIAG